MFKKFAFPMLAAAALLASCSQEDALQPVTDGTLQTVIISAGTDGSMTTRATNGQGDEEVSRCLLQIFEKTGEETPAWQPMAGYETPQSMTGSEAGGFTATAILNPTKEYAILFWADTETYDATADLQNVKVKDDTAPGIAYAGKTGWGGNNTAASIDVDLKHAVAKVTLRSTTAVPADRTVTLTGLKEYSAFDVQSNTVTDEKTFTHEVTGTGSTGDIMTFYALVQEETQTLTLNTGGADVQIPNVPLAPDKHVILMGDVANAGLTTVTFTAAVDPTWGGSSTEIFTPIDLTEKPVNITGDGIHKIVGNGQQTANTITINGNATVYLEGVDINTSTDAISITGGSPTLHVRGSNSLTSSDGAGIYVAQGSTVTITSDDRNANTLAAQGGTGGSGIGAKKQDCGNIVIENVTVNAHGSKVTGLDGSIYAAGIGGSGSNSCGTITISNATVSAYGASDGAAGNMSTPGIGGGLKGSSNGSYGIITINKSSTVSVQRGSWVSDYIGSAGHTNDPASSPDGIDATVDDTSEVKKLN